MDFGVWLLLGLLGLAAAVALGEWIGIAAVVIVGSQIFQWLKTGVWSSITLGSFWQIPVDTHFTNWVVIEKVLHYSVFELDVWIIMVAVGAAGCFVKEKLEEARFSQGFIRKAYLSGFAALLGLVLYLGWRNEALSEVVYALGVIGVPLVLLGLGLRRLQTLAERRNGVSPWATINQSRRLRDAGD